jgi:hypothetical protein
VSPLSDGPVTAVSSADASPAIELECRYDDPDDPSELTVFSPELPNRATEWLTVDRATAIPLDRFR